MSLFLRCSVVLLLLASAAHADGVLVFYTGENAKLTANVESISRRKWNLPKFVWIDVAERPEIAKQWKVDANKLPVCIGVVEAGFGNFEEGRLETEFTEAELQALTETTLGNDLRQSITRQFNNAVRYIQSLLPRETY